MSVGKQKVLPTLRDEENLSRYLLERKKLYDYNKFLLISPHIASHFIVKIRAATQEDYYFENKFRDSAIIVEILPSSKSCESSNCFPGYPRGQKCKTTTTPKPFKSGDDIVIGCNPACHNLFSAPQNDKIQSPLVGYNKRLEACLFKNLGYEMWGREDFYRAEKPTPNITDIGTGFNMRGEMVNEEGYGIPLFDINKQYCDHFNLDFIEGTNKFSKCDTSTGQDVGGFLFGSYIYALMGYSGEWIEKQFGVGSNIISSELTDVETHTLPPPSVDIKAWKSDTRPNSFLFKTSLLLSELGINANTKHMTWTNEFNPMGQLIEPALIYTIVPMEGFEDGKRPDYLPLTIEYTKKLNYKDNLIPPEYKIGDTGFRTLKQPPPKFDKSLTDHVDKSNGDITSALIDSLFSFDTARQLYLGIVVDDFTQLLKQTIIKLIKRLAPVLFQSIETSIVKLSSRIALSVVRTITVQIVAREIATIVTKALVTFAKLTAFALDAATWVFLISNIVDIFLTLWDPYNLNKRLNPDILKHMAEATMAENVKLFGSVNAEYDMTIILASIEANTPKVLIDKIMEDNLKQFSENGKGLPFVERKMQEPEQVVLLTCAAEFMLSFEKNSDGSLYLWHETDDDINFNDANDQMNNQYSDLHLDLYNYNYHFRNRLTLQNTMKNASIIGLGTVALVGLSTSSVFFYITLSVLLLILMYTNTIMFQSNSKIDTIVNYQYELINGISREIEKIKN
ncbi:MAG: hypothetical protein ACRYGG_14430 [Janthinobacterium lividum]